VVSPPPEKDIAVRARLRRKGAVLLLDQRGVDVRPYAVLPDADRLHVLTAGEGPVRVGHGGAALVTQADDLDRLAGLRGSDASIGHAERRSSGILGCVRIGGDRLLGGRTAHAGHEKGHERGGDGGRTASGDHRDAFLSSRSAAHPTVPNAAPSSGSPPEPGR
jgi:hypothetical protein